MKNLLIGLIALGVTTSALADETKPKKKIVKTVVTTTTEEVDEKGNTTKTTVTEDKTESENDVKIVKDNTVFEDSSAHHRMNKKFAAWLQLWGVGPSLSASGALAFGYYHTRNDILFLEVTGGSGGYSTWDGSEYNIDTSSIGVHWKHFTGNSF